MSTQMNPLVSVIIPNYNYGKHLPEAIDSVLAQTYRNIEVIVVDDGSTDSSKDVLDSYADRIRVIYQKNAGVCAARNNGVANSNGELVAFLDADDVWMPEKIERQIAVLDGGRGILVVHVGIEEIDVDGKAIRVLDDGMSGDVADELLRLERSVILGAGSGLLTTREAFDAVGGFDVRLSTSADWDLSYRLARRHKVAFVSEPLMKYRTHSTNMHSNIGVMERDMLLAFEKAFAEDAGVSKRLCYGNLHRTISGSYFRCGNYRQFVRHGLLSVLNRPRNIFYFVAFPMRRLMRNG